MIYENSQEGKCPKCSNPHLDSSDVEFGSDLVSHSVFCDICHWYGSEVYSTKFLRMEDGEK